MWIWYLLFDNARFQRWLARHRRNGWELEHVGCLFFRLVCSSDTRYRYYVQVMKDDPDTERGRAYLAGVEELGVTCLGCFRHRAFFRWEDDGRPVEMFSDLASQALEAKCVQLYTRTGNGAGSKTDGSFTNRLTGKEIPMDDVKKTWCGPVYTLDPENMERQFNRLSAEGWQLEGMGWFSFRYRRGEPNEYRYRVQYIYESRDNQKDDYVRRPDSGKRDRLSTPVGGGHPHGRPSRSAVACNGRRLSPTGVPLREAAPQAAAGAAC